MSRAATNTPGFETPPPKPGSIEWQAMRDDARRRQELYRKRIPIPVTITGDVPAANNALFAKHPEVTADQATVARAGVVIKLFFFVAALLFGGVLMIQKFAPRIVENFNDRFNPWKPVSASEREFPAIIRAEEESFSRFLTTFRVGPPPTAHDDSPKKENPVNKFYIRASKRLAAQQKLLRSIGLESSAAARQKALEDLALEMSALKDEAGFPEALPVWQVAFATEGLLKQLVEKTGNVTPSTLRAVAGGMDLLKDLCVPGLKPDLLTDHPFKFLVVDDDLISRQAVSLALKKTFDQPDVALDGETALAQAGQQAYDVVFLDVQLPGMDGFELCAKIHDTALNRATPAVFVTNHNDFDARAKSILSGGNDLMGKPFLTFEITVKAITFALRSRLEKHKAQHPSALSVAGVALRN